MISENTIPYKRARLIYFNSSVGSFMVFDDTPESVSIRNALYKVAQRDSVMNRKFVSKRKNGRLTIKRIL